MAPLGARTFEIIEVLVCSGGSLISKEGLINNIWPGAIVSDNTLQVHISAIRKALGPYRAQLKTESGRGYRLVGDWTTRQQDAGVPSAEIERPQTVDGRPPTNFPAFAGALVGRAAAVAQLRDRLSAYRVVTLTGPGGIGKTVLALEVARMVLPGFRDGGWLVELASLSDENLVPTTVSAALNLRLAGDVISAEMIARAIAGRYVLLVLDNCEHVIDATAGLAETILRLCPHVTVLATSREALRIAGEHIYHVPPLAVPPSNLAKPDDILKHSAVEFFVTRTRAQDASFAPNADNLSTVVAICRQLDGIPLAIEFAATRAAVLGIAEVAKRLDDRFQLLTSGRRTALPRHQTLRAALDWSYHLLPESERLLLRHLAVFRAGFTVDAAAAAVKYAGLDALAVTQGIVNLITKSLVALAQSDTAPRWYLLETIRAYAAEKLAQHNELDRAAWHHAAYFRDLLASAAPDFRSRLPAENVVRYGREIDNVRAALDWAFSPSGDAAIGIVLTAASVPLWIDLSMMSECRQHVEEALARSELIADLDLQQEMQLRAALGLSLNYTTGPVAATAKAWTRTLEIAKSLRNTEYQLRGLRGLWAHHMNAGEYRRALTFADQFCDIAAKSPDPADLSVGDRMAAIMLHYLGNQEAALGRLKNALGRAVIGASPTSRFLLDREVTIQALLARILWLRGFSDQATQAAQLAVKRASTIGHGLSLCHALAQAACPVAHYTGDLARAGDAATLLLHTASQQGLVGWVARGRCLRGMVSIARGDFVTGVPLLRSALAELHESGAAPGSPVFLAELAAGLGRAGQAKDGLAAIDEALALVYRHEEYWCHPELLRTKGELHLLDTVGKPTELAEDCFRQALDQARQDKTLAWEMRAAVSLARLWYRLGRRDNGRDLVAAVYDRFTEGFDTADLKKQNVSSVFCNWCRGLRFRREGRRCRSRRLDLRLPPIRSDCAAVIHEIRARQPQELMKSASTGAT